VVSQVEEYRDRLRSFSDWDDFLLAESGLPGPRANLELARAVAEEGDEARFERYLALDAEGAPDNSPEEFLAFCGVLGAGRLLAEGRGEMLERLRALACDPRWRIREAVAQALQRFGRADMEGLLHEMERWADGSLLEKRAAAAGLCEPALLKYEKHVHDVLKILDRITAAILVEADRRGDEFKVLRKGLGYCWSVVVAAMPEAGERFMEHWLVCDDPDVRWIVKENLRKARMARADPEWVEAWKAELGM
jgi:hypothetical protein